MVCKPGSGSENKGGIVTSELVFADSYFFFFSSRRRHTIFDCDWSSDVCSSDLVHRPTAGHVDLVAENNRVVRRTAFGKIGQVFPLAGLRVEASDAGQRMRIGDRKSVV